MNLANKLTVFRMILVPVFVIIGYLGTFGVITGNVWGIPMALFIMNIVFIIASITDKLDGYIARSRNQVTTFGKFLDPLADKILVLSALVMLVEYGKLPGWIPVIVLAREFIVSGYRMLAVEKGGKVIAASFWGKLKTATTMVAIIVVFFDKFAFCSFLNTTMNAGEYVWNVIGSVLMIVSVVATIFSGYDYLKGGKEFLKDN
jgi:CDP-diacylglycerol--glycerol-3-phosphate 3-phosphatidyltransferase